VVVIKVRPKRNLEDLYDQMRGAISVQFGAVAFAKTAEPSKRRQPNRVL